ncbi:MAG: phosphatidate cytidylyltransferase [Solirubrobacterales bacterium]
MDFPPRPREAAPEPPRARASRREPGPPTEPPGPPAAEPRGRRRPRRETIARIAVAVPWIALAIFIVAVGGIPFALAMIGFSVIGLSELFRMTRRYRPMVPVAFAAAAAMVVAAYYGTQFQIVLVIVVAFPVMFLYATRRQQWTGVTHSMAVTVFGIAWIGLPFAHAVLLRELPAHGGALVIDVLVGTFLTDTAAYAGGRLFGRHKLAPTLSPNKTLEGLAFGLVGGTMGFWFAGLYQDWLSGFDALAMGICIAIFAVLGDLFESMVKRDLQIKDSGNVFGPHGGLLDRLDALMFTIVVGYYLAVAFVY